MYLAATASGVSSVPQYKIWAASDTAKLDIVAIGNEFELENMTQANTKRR
jgi:hypothetical protein